MPRIDPWRTGATHDEGPRAITGRSPSTITGQLTLPLTRTDLGSSWTDLVVAAPALAEIEADMRLDLARLIRLDGFCAAEYWACPDGPKPRIGSLVGCRHSFDPVIGSAAAYDVAKDHLRGLLPDCGHRDVCRGHGRTCLNCWEAC